MVHMMNNFAIWLNDFMEQKDLTQEALAGLIGGNGENDNRKRPGLEGNCQQQKRDEKQDTD